MTRHHLPGRSACDTIKIQWIPCFSIVEGNEITDELADKSPSVNPINVRYKTTPKLKQDSLVVNLRAKTHQHSHSISIKKKLNGYFNLAEYN